MQHSIESTFKELRTHILDQTNLQRPDYVFDSGQYQKNWANKG